MANPQKENGYTAISNELLEAFILAGLTSTELSICLFVMRKTYGFRKKEDAISISQFVHSTTYSRRGIIDCLKSLQSKNILLCKKNNFKKINTWKINKDYIKWAVNQSALVKYGALVNQGSCASEPECTYLVNQSAHTKETPKETNKRKKKILNSIRKQLKRKKII